MIKNKFLLMTVLTITSVLIIISCASPNFTPRSLESPELAYCNDATGHVEGNKPFPMEGKCTCTPDEEHFVQLKKEGSIDREISFEDFQDMYEAQGIVSDLNHDHKGDNNMCELGPHVVFGGNCMATPTPGTLNYERVVSGNENLTHKNHDHGIVEKKQKYVE